MLGVVIDGEVVDAEPARDVRGARPGLDHRVVAGLGHRMCQQQTEPRPAARSADPKLDREVIGHCLRHWSSPLSILSIRTNTHRHGKMLTMKLRLLPLLVVGFLLVGGPALAAGPDNSSVTGNDVSYPQCGKALPSRPAFGIVGVNGGKASTLNPCFSTQITWAKASVGGTSQPAAALYVNTGNPGDVYVTRPASVSYWPTAGANSFGTCTGGNDAACAYEYGKYMAQRDTIYVRSHDATTDFDYWLDVETGNSWSLNTLSNQASLIGMVDYFNSLGANVGLYSTSYQWRQIAGDTSDPDGRLAGLDSWLAGARSRSGARSNCSLAPLTPNGEVTLTQYVSGGFDYDYACP